MKRIGLKAEYFPLVENGRKRSTIRAGAKPDLLGRALLVGGARSMLIEVTDVVVKHYAQLSESDAQLDGFSCLAELNQALERFYPDLSPNDVVSIIHFMPVQASAST